MTDATVIEDIQTAARTLRLAAGRATNVALSQSLEAVAVQCDDLAEYAITGRLPTVLVAVGGTRRAPYVPRDECSHDDTTLMESGNLWCSDCGSEVVAEDGTIVYQEPTSAQLEAMNNPDSGPSERHYRDSMRDAGRGGLLG